MVITIEKKVFTDSLFKSKSAEYQADLTFKLVKRECFLFTYYKVVAYCGKHSVSLVQSFKSKLSTEDVILISQMMDKDKETITYGTLFNPHSYSGIISGVSLFTIFGVDHIQNAYGKLLGLASKQGETEKKNKFLVNI